MKKIIILLVAILCLSLTACSNNKDNTASLPTDENPSIPVNSNTPTNDTTTSETSSDTYDIDALREDAKELWNDFLESVSVIETDSQYAPILKVYKDTADFRAGYYEKVTGSSKSEYLDMSIFEQFLWYSTYIFPVNTTTASGYETYFGSLAKWNSNVAGTDYNLLKNHGATEQAEAYRTLMEWQYNFFLQTGSMYNFITEKTSIEENPNYIIPAPQ